MNDYSEVPMAGMATAKSSGGKRAKVLDSIEVKQAEGGGHVISHRFDNSGPGNGYHEPEVHVFGATEGSKMLAHVAKVMNVPDAKEEQSEVGKTGKAAKGDC